MSRSYLEHLLERGLETIVINGHAGFEFATEATDQTTHLITQTTNNSENSGL